MEQIKPFLIIIKREWEMEQQSHVLAAEGIVATGVTVAIIVEMIALTLIFLL
jgi:hypothetical protein